MINLFWRFAIAKNEITTLRHLKKILMQKYLFTTFIFLTYTGGRII